MPNELSIQPGPPGFALSFPWAEVVNDRSTYSSQWDNNASSAIMNIQINGADRALAVGEIIGWPLRVAAPGGNWKSPTKLQRNTPWRHPYWDWLRATRIGPMQGLKFTGKSQDPVSEYKFEYLTITFSTLPYEVVTDDEMASDPNLKEWDRYTFKKGQNNVTLAQYGGSENFKYSSDAPSGVANQPIKGVQRTIPIATEAIEFTWYNVPNDYLFNSSKRAPQIDTGLSKVNSADWNGYKAGTLLFEGWRYEAITAPVDPIYLNLFSGSIPRLWNVVFSFKYFDPDRDPGLSTDTYQSRGHNLAPNVSIPLKIGGGVPPSTYWYPVTMANGCSPYTGYAFANLFKDTNDYTNGL